VEPTGQGRSVARDGIFSFTNMATALSQPNSLPGRPSAEGAGKSRPEGRSFGLDMVRPLLVWGGAVLLFLAVCGCLRLVGCVRLEAATSRLQEAERTLLATERSSDYLKGVIAGRMDPRGVTFARESSDMELVSPDRAISWLRTARIAESAATLSDSGKPWP